jgi:hypothetical protein
MTHDETRDMWCQGTDECVCGGCRMVREQNARTTAAPQSDPAGWVW